MPVFPGYGSDRFSVHSVGSSDKLVLIHPDHPLCRSFLNYWRNPERYQQGWLGWVPFTLSLPLFVGPFYVIEITPAQIAANYPTLQLILK